MATRKRCFAIILLISLAVMTAASCGAAIDTGSGTSQSPEASDSGIGPYDIVKKTYSNNKNITIRLPQIENLGDDVKQAQLNAVLKDDALKLLNNYDEWAKQTGQPADDAVAASIDYEVMFQGSHLLSVVYWGGSSLQNIRSERDFHTINLDLATGELLRLKDFVNIDRSFVDKFIGGKFISNNSIYSDAAGNKAITDEVNQSLDFLYQIKSTPDYDGLLRFFKGADEVSADGIVTSCNFSYITDHSVGIAVMVSHASGNYAEFEISFEDIKDNLNTDCEIWQDFPGVFPAQN